MRDFDEIKCAHAAANQGLADIAAHPTDAEPEAPKTCTVTFSDGQTFEDTVGEDFVFFFQCDAPGGQSDALA